MLENVAYNRNDEIGIVIESKVLFKEATSVRIQHGNDVYILRVTKTNKLILTK